MSGPDPVFAFARLVKRLEPGDLVNLDLGTEHREERLNTARAVVDHAHGDISVCLAILTPAWATKWEWKGCGGMLRIPYRSPLVEEPLYYGIRRASSPVSA